MSTNEVAETSRIAYRKMILSGKAINQDTLIYLWLCKFTNKKKKIAFTRNEIAEYMKLRVGSVCGRINTLILSNLAEELPDKREDRFTKETASVIVVTDPSKPITRWFPEQVKFDFGVKE